MDSFRIYEVPGLIDEISQRTRLLSLRIEAADPVDARALAQLLPQELHLQEALSEPYRAELVCLTTDPAFALRQALGRPACIMIAGEFATDRLVCGLVTGVTRLGADGSLTAFQLRIEPTLALLAQRRNARVFQDLSVPQIVQTILDEHIAGNSAIRATFQHQADLIRAYPARSYCVQYDEDDLAFITRLLAEEGITYRFEHRQTDDGAAQHVLHLVDHEAAFGADSATTLRYARDGATNTAQTLTQWEARAEVIGAESAVVSYDYKLAGVRAADRGARLTQGDLGDQAAASLEDYAALAPYAAPGRDELERYAQLRQQARDLTGKEFVGQGPTLGLLPGQWFALERHPAHATEPAEQRQFRVLGQTLVARNNLPADLEKIGLALLARSAAVEDAASDGWPVGPLLADGQRYRTRVIAVRRQIPVVPPNAGQRHKRTAPGPQTARVVGPETDTVHTDALGRVRIQFHWQRRAGAAMDESQYSTWVRVATANAGNGFGVQFLPRVGDEVLVDFIENDISRPVVVASLYNGRHAPPRFSGQGDLPGNRVLSGIQTQEYRGSGYNELVFDDTPSSLQARLASSAGASALNLGDLVYSRIDGQAEPRGRGAELRSDQAVAIRGGHGVLLSAHAQHQAQGVALERADVLGTAQALQGVHASLADMAQAQDAGGTDTQGVDALVQHLTHWQASPEATSKAGLSRPIIAISAPASTFVSSQQSLTLGAEQHVDLVGAANVQASAGKQLLLRAAETISLMAHSLGMKLIAAAGVLQIRASQDDIEISAGKRIRLVAGTEIDIQAPKVRITTQGAQTEWTGGVITQASSGAHVIKSASFAQHGPASATVPDLPLATAPMAADERFVLRLRGSQEVLSNCPYQVLRVADGSVVAQGVSDGQGRTSLDARQSFDGLRVHANPPQES
ncbi:type VI secretion system Vgr family protein [Achromobacter ruhlandii]|uniref:type VI secretion system Vgr family protein n=1 Tax=Achromobacter ruhlandii TaxID=72557 RepID=UPI003BA063D7